MPLAADGCSLRLWIKEAFCGWMEAFGKATGITLSLLNLPLSPHTEKKRAGTVLCCCCCSSTTARGFHVFRDINLAQTNDNKLNPWLRNGLNVL